MDAVRDVSVEKLSAEEHLLWSKLSAVLELLPAALNSQLGHDNQLTLFDYFVLNELSVAAPEPLRMTALASDTHASLPRVSRVVSRLECGGLVERIPCPEDGRAINVRLTAVGASRLAEAEPGHLQTVRALVLDALSAEQTDALTSILDNLLEALGSTVRQQN